MKKVCCFVALVVIILTACSNNAEVSSISLVEQPQFGQGVYRLSGADGLRDIKWSPRGNVLAGLISFDPPAPDCPPFPLACWLADSSRDFNSEVFVIDLQHKQKRLVLKSAKTGKAIDRIFWMADGERIGYIVSQYGSPDLGTWSIDTQGQDDLRISQATDYPVWNRDGTEFATWGPQSIDLVDASSGKRQRLFDGTVSGANVFGVSWSSDDRTLAFSYGNASADHPEDRPEIYLMDTATRTISRMPGDQYEQQTFPAFSPMDNLLLYIRRQPSFFQSTLVIRDISTECQISLPVPYSSNVSWSPDGSELLINEYDGAYILNLTEFVGVPYEKSHRLCPAN